VLQQAAFVWMLSNGDSTSLTLSQSLTCCYTGNKLVRALGQVQHR
jgi:hypothetical protein